MPEALTIPAPAKEPVKSNEVEANLISDNRKEKKPLLTIQPKLTVGAPDDPYEKEADSVADKVMRMPEKSFIHKKCAACEEEKVQRKVEEDKTLAQAKFQTNSSFIQLKYAACEKEEKDKVHRKLLSGSFTPFIQKKSNGESVASDSLASSIQNSKGSGSSMDGGTQSFMENRFGRDFSNVKIHTGSQSVQMNKELNAQAFTTGSDIYFNNGKYQPQSESGKQLLAHELTHVVQQGGSSIQTKPFIQRAYWVGVEPSGKEKTGTKIHNEVLEAMGNANPDLFTEAPVPNADSKSVAYGNRGSADFYKASTTVGLEFQNHFQPGYLEPQGKLRYGGKKYNHKKNSAPNYDGSINIANAPSKILVGDLKPYGAEELDPKYEEQVGNYVKGYEKVGNEISEMAADTKEKKKINPEGGTWKLSADKLKGATSLKIPDDYKAGSATAPSQRIILKEGKRKKYFLKKKITGKMYLAYRKDQEGIWNYFWVPDTPVTVASLPSGVAALQVNINSIINPLIDTRLQPKRIGHEKNSNVEGGAADKVSKENNTIRKRGITPSPPDKKDKFDYAKDWEPKWKDFTGKYKATPENEIENAEGLVSGRETQKELSSKFSGVNDGGSVSDSEKGNIKLVKQIKFWSHPMAYLVGKLRQVFGKVFVKAYNVIQKIKTKVQALIKKGRAAISKSGIVGAVIKLLIKIFKMVGKYMVEKTIDLILNSIIQGAKAKLQQFIDSIIPDDVDKYIEEIKRIQSDFEKIAVEKVESLFEPYLEHFKTFKEIEEKASSLMTIINLVRWGARVIACLSPPAIGCLWAIASGILEEIAARVVDSCWFIRKVGSRVAESLMQINAVKNIPVTAAAFIIKTANGMLPAGWQSTFPEPSVSDLSAIKAGYDGSCPEEEGGGGSEPFDENRQKIIELIEEIGEEKFKAMLELSLKRGAGPWVLLTPERLAELKEKLKNVSAEELKNVTQDPKATIPASLEEFLKSIKTYSKKEQKLIDDHQKAKEAKESKGDKGKSGDGDKKAGGESPDSGQTPNYKNPGKLDDVITGITYGCVMRGSKLETGKTYTEPRLIYLGVYFKKNNKFFKLFFNGLETGVQLIEADHVELINKKEFYGYYDDDNKIIYFEKNQIFKIATERFLYEDNIK